jgi:cysteinyl-tRNA synthetase
LVDRGFHPLAYRLMCLQTHYRSEMEFTWQGLAAALVRLKRMVRMVSWHRQNACLSGPSPELWARNWLVEIEADIGDDLATPWIVARLDDLLGIRTQNSADVLELLQTFDSLLGLAVLSTSLADLRIRPASATLTEADIEVRLAERKAARATKDFATSDRIRDDLIAAGVEVMDGDPLGWDWKLDI